MMRYALPIAALIALLMIAEPLPVFSGGKPQSKSNNGQAGPYNSTEEELQFLNDQILLIYKADAEFIEKYKKAQTAWYQFRYAYLESLYPAEDKLQAYGSNYRRCYQSALNELNRYRIDQLRVWIDGRNEGDVCSGSVQFR